MKQKFLFLLAVLASSFSFAQTRESAVINTMNERYELASSDFKKLIAAEPANGDLYFYAGDNYFYWGLLDSAEVMFRKGQEVAPTNPLNFVGLGRIGWYTNNTALSNAQFEKAVSMMTAKGAKVDKNIQVSAYLKMAEAYTQAENKMLEKALEYINKAININDKDAEAYVQLGDYNAEKDAVNLSAALAQYSKALQLNPKYTRALLREGQLYVRVRNWEEGLKYFNQAIEVDPTFAPAYREKAELLHKANRDKQAVEVYAKYLELNNSCRVQQRYASFVFETKDYKQAVIELEKAAPCDPSNPFMARLLGYSYFETGQFEKGLANINSFFAVAESKGSPKLLGSDYAYKGKLMAKTGQDSLGVEVIKQAIAIDPTYLDGYSDIAGIYVKAKKYALAAEYYQKKIAATTGELNALDHYFLGQALFFNKEYARADAAFAVAVTKYADSNFWRGRCNARLDNAEAPTGMAAPFFSAYITAYSTDAKAIETNKKNLIESYTYFGITYLNQNNLECSRYAWNKVIEMDPANEKAKLALEDKELAAVVGNCDGFGTLAPVAAPDNNQK
jgi:tetratricopeptide (TPR) repeat protein